MFSRGMSSVLGADVATGAAASTSSHVALTSMRLFTLRRETSVRRMATTGRVADCARTKRPCRWSDGLGRQKRGRYSVHCSDCWRIMQAQHELRRSVVFLCIAFAAPTAQCVGATSRRGCCAPPALLLQCLAAWIARTLWPRRRHELATRRSRAVRGSARRTCTVSRPSYASERLAARRWVSKRSSVAVLLMDDAMGSRVHSRALDPARRRSALTRSQTHFLPSCRIDLRAPLSRERLSRLALSHKRVLGSTPATRVQIAQKMPHDVVLPARYRRAYHFAGGCIIEGFPRSRCSYNIAHAFDTCV